MVGRKRPPTPITDGTDIMGLRKRVGGELASGLGGNDKVARGFVFVILMTLAVISIAVHAPGQLIRKLRRRKPTN
jgi:hypothetical protein